MKWLIAVPLAVHVLFAVLPDPPPTAPPPMEIGPDGAGGAWMTVGPDDAMLTINNAGAISLMECPKPKIMTVGGVTEVDCGPVFRKKLSAAVLAELKRRK